MKRFKKILLVLPADADGGAAVQMAANLARHNRARITLFDVVPKFGARRMFSVKGRQRKQIQAVVVAHREDELADLAKSSLGAESGVAVKVSSGTPFIEVVREVLGGGHDIVVKPAEGASPTRIFGSSDMHLMRKCPCPVWVLKDDKNVDVKRVLAAVDPVGAEQRLLSGKIVDLAGALCAREGASLQLVHAWDFPHEHALRSRSVLSEDAIAGMRAEIARGHEEEVRKLLRRRSVRGLHPEIRVVEGGAAETIADLAREQGIDVIVMGTVGRSGVAGLFIGNTAERVLHDVTCSVLAVKPDGFASPVEAR